MAINIAPISGANVTRTLARSARGRNVCSCPARYNVKYPSPANAKLEWPLGKERKPSFKRCESVCVQAEMSMSLCAGVPGAGLQRAMRSGRGLPIAFLTTCVRKFDRLMLISNPNIVTWDLCRLERVRSDHSMRMPRGMKPA